MIYQNNFFKYIILAFFGFFLNFNSSLAMESTDDSEDKISKAVIKASIIPTISANGEWYGEGLGRFLTDWVITRAYARESGSMIRNILGLSDTGNKLDKWVPLGATVGGYFGSIAVSVISMALVDRYYSPWKRFSRSLLNGDYYLEQTKNSDSRKIIESITLGSFMGYLVYNDLIKIDIIRKK